MAEKSEEEKEIDRRRDEIARRMLKTPPKPHTPPKPKEPTEPKKGGARGQRTPRKS